MFKLVADAFMLFIVARSIRFEPEKLLRGGEGVGVRTSRGGNIGESAGDGSRGLQIESGVGPA